MYLVLVAASKTYIYNYICCWWDQHQTVDSYDYHYLYRLGALNSGFCTPSRGFLVPSSVFWGVLHGRLPLPSSPGTSAFVALTCLPPWPMWNRPGVWSHVSSGGEFFGWIFAPKNDDHGGNEDDSLEVECCGNIGECHLWRSWTVPQKVRLEIAVLGLYDVVC